MIDTTALEGAEARVCPHLPAELHDTPVMIYFCDDGVPALLCVTCHVEFAGLVVTVPGVRVTIGKAREVVRQ